jgi:hypothetical protein
VVARIQEGGKNVNHSSVRQAPVQRFKVHPNASSARTVILGIFATDHSLKNYRV